MFAKAIGRWVAIAVAVPLAAAGARRLSRELESRRGPSRASRLLSKGADVLRPVNGRKRRSWLGFR